MRGRLFSDENKMYFSTDERRMEREAEVRTSREESMVSFELRTQKFSSQFADHIPIKEL